MPKEKPKGAEVFKIYRSSIHSSDVDIKEQFLNQDIPESEVIKPDAKTEVHHDSVITMKNIKSPAISRS